MKVLLLDADGVVVDHDQYFSQQAIDLYSLNRSKVEKFFQTTFQECTLGKKDLVEELDKVIADWGWQGSVEEFIKEWFAAENAPNQEILEHIKILATAGIGIFLASKQEKHRAYYLLESMKFNKLFEYSFFTFEVGHPKNSPAFWTYVTESLQYLADIDQANQIIYYDDHPEIVEVAKKHGIDARHYTDVDTFIHHTAPESFV